MNAAQTGLQTAAYNIANLGTDGTDGFRRQRVQQTPSASAGVDVSVSQAPQAGSSLETDVVGALQAKNAFLANLAVFAASDRLMGSLLDVTS
jgi:flagellar basal body rod protein FlgC